MILIKRAYDPPDAGDGRRFLIDRLWPRGTTRTALKIDSWVRDVAPSSALRRYFHRDPAKWLEFRKRYLAELRDHPEGLETLIEAARTGTVTLVYGARDELHNNAVVLHEYLTRHIRDGAPRGASRSPSH